MWSFVFFFQAEDGIRDDLVTGVQTCALPILIATKFGIVRDPTHPQVRGVNGKPEYVRKSCEGSLRRLGIDRIDLYYQHRVDPNTPIEETVGAMAQLVKEGKVSHIGLSEAGPQTLRRAVKVHP